MSDRGVVSMPQPGNGPESGAGRLPADWREQLVTRLGIRPRRIGLWAETALYGARRCLDLNGIDCLAGHAVVRVTSSWGPVEALALVGETCEARLLPMPFDFLQSQPSQMLAALSLYLQWRGDASFMALDGWDDLLARAHVEAGALQRRAEQAQQPWAGLLLGRVDLGPVPTSQWHWIA